jgi:COP9 signalosome complex subunit 4
MASLSEKINSIDTTSDPKSKLERYKSLIQEIFSSQDTHQAKSLIQHILSQEIPLVLARQVLSVCAEQMEILKNDPLIEVAEFALELLAGRVAAFEEEDAKVRQHLADAVSAKGDYYKAAKVLAGTVLEGASRQISTQDKAEKYVQIAEFYLEADDPVTAEVYNSKAAMIIHQIDNTTLNLRHRVCHARILDSKREFLQAARAYYSLSQEGHHGVVESDLLKLLHCAITCTILAKAGPQRSRLLATLYKDERSVHLDNYEILQKMFMDRILKKPEIHKFSETLQEHQKAKLSSGFTVLDKAIIEHNIVAISKIYTNITFQELGALLEIPPSRAENIIATMSSENRIKAVLDQLNGVVEFEDSNLGLASWENKISNLCSSVDKLVEYIAARYPEGS